MSLPSDTKELILMAAARVFARFGPSKGTVEDIAREAGVGKATIYYYFSSKYEILREVVAREADQVAKRLRQAVNEVSDPKGKLEALVMAKVEGLKEALNLAWLNGAEGQRFVDLAAEQARIEETELELLEEIVEEGGRMGVLSAENLPGSVSFLQALVRGLESVLHSSSNLASEARERVRAVCGLAFRALELPAVEGG